MTVHRTPDHDPLTDELTDFIRGAIDRFTDNEVAPLNTRTSSEGETVIVDQTTGRRFLIRLNEIL
jgi:hypothetical protein